MMGKTATFEELFPPIDEKKTIKNVQHFLSRTLPQMIRVSGHSLADLRSPSMDGMPKSAPAGNGAEERITRRLYAEQVVKQSIVAMNHCDHNCQEILDQLYLQGCSDTMCYVGIGYSKSQYFDHWKPVALLQFAESYMLDDLFIYQNRTQTGL